ncbi:MAG: SDR family oxidoreductase [Planctomycetaceae bacterium]|nr:SDR family oxidoreductase [Planctomycetaceae bacterium]
MPVVFLTGFPGFLASGLLPRILERAPSHQTVCLVQPQFIDVARARLKQIQNLQPAFRGRIELREGDITHPGLGLTDPAALQKRTSEIFHLAALYDLCAPREVAMKVNLEGTSNVLDFAAGTPQLQRLHYVSTCYVSGRHRGSFSEDDLEKGQSFHNPYEESKYLAELAVRTRMNDGLPATIYRPAIVVGDSQTGATQKYDGPYFVIRWLLRQPRVAVLPVTGDPTATQVNLVPQDYIVQAISYLSGLQSSAGRTYHLADPHPLTVEELVTLLGQATHRRIVRIPLPLWFAKFAINHLLGVDRLMQIPSPAIDYFVHPTRYACEQTLRALNGSGIRVPEFQTYVDRLVNFVRLHPKPSHGF